MKKKIAKCFTAYQGAKFTVEWYYTEEGKSPALEYFNDLTKQEKIKVLRLFELLGTEGKILNIEKFRNEGDGIYAFKPQPHRFLSFFFEGAKIIVTNGFMKKKDSLPRNEKDRAINYQKDYESRVKKGMYYEEKT